MLDSADAYRRTISHCKGVVPAPGGTHAWPHACMATVARMHGHTHAWPQWHACMVTAAAQRGQIWFALEGGSFSEKGLGTL